MVPNSPLKNGLFVRRPLSNAILLFLSWLFRCKKGKSSIPKSPKKILLCNIANFGDVVISTAVLPVIKRHYPDCEIGFLTSNASAVVLENHPLISRIHTFDHWTPNKCKAVLHLLFGSRRLIQKLKSHRYDLAIDLYSYFPNAIPLLAKSQIPVRISYTTGGFSNLLTHPVEWGFPDRYVGYAHLHLLKVLGIDVSGESPLPNYKRGKSISPYIVVHMGSLNPLKEWKVEKWIALIRRLEADGCQVVLTGKGKREKEICSCVARQTLAKDLSHQLSWTEFVLTIQEARLLIAVDSVAVHIAAGSLTSTIVLFAGMNAPQMWLPPFPLCKGIMKPVPCAPCFNKKGCPALACIKEIEVDQVYGNAIKLCKNFFTCNSPIF